LCPTRFSIGGYHGTTLVQGAADQLCRPDWLTLAVATAEDPDWAAKAQRFRDDIAGKMTPDQITAATQKAAEWQPKTAE